jgi:hypothetical protein
MTTFEKITESPEVLAAFLYGLLEQTEDDILDTIYCTTGMIVTRVSLSQELRIASLLADLNKECDNDTA